MARFDITEAAANDIAAIADYTEESWGTAQAQLYLDALELRLGRLASHPALGRTRDELASGIRSARFESHIVYYRRARSGILVLRVVHARRDPVRHLD